MEEVDKKCRENPNLAGLRGSLLEEMDNSESLYAFNDRLIQLIRRWQI